MEEMYQFRKIGINEIELIKELFISVFTIDPWNDDWSNQEQLDLYMYDLVGQSTILMSCAYGWISKGMVLELIF